MGWVSSGSDIMFEPEPAPEKRNTHGRDARATRNASVILRSSFDKYCAYCTAPCLRRKSFDVDTTDSV